LGYPLNENYLKLKLSIIFSLLLSFLFLFVGCQNADRKGHEQMVALLKKLNEQTNTPENYYKNSLRVGWYASKAEKSNNQIERLQFLFEKGCQELYAGFSVDAIKTFESLQDSLRFIEMDSVSLQSTYYTLKRHIALSWLRLGEQENCIQNHTTFSCTLPIHNKGFHQLKTGSEKAASIYFSLLKENVQDLESRWLYNLAQMTLGKYPDETPDVLLFPDSIFPLNKNNTPSFTEVGMKKGINQTGLSGGSIAEDFNNDGYIDLMVSSWELDDQVQLFYNQPNGTFKEVTKEAGLEGITGGLNMVHCDFNRDGFADILILRGAWRNQAGLLPNSLLRNNGDDTFTDITFEAGLKNLRPTQAACWQDFNGDDLPDLFIANETYSSIAPMPCELYINLGNEKFEEHSKTASIDLTGFFKGTTSSDYNNDGRPDIFISNLEGEDFLLKNVGNNDLGIPVFENTTVNAGLAGNFASFPCWFFDYNQDGLDDLMVFSLDFRRRNAFEDVVNDFFEIPTEADKARLYHNNGDGTFTNITDSIGLEKVLLVMGSNFGDINNDGWLDLYLGTGTPDLNTIIPNRLFLNEEGKYFQDITFQSGTGNIQKGHGVSFADFDLDGDLDIHITMGGAVEGDTYQNLLFENHIGSKNNWVKIETPKWKVGSQLELSFIEKGKQRKIFQKVGSGGSFGGSPFLQHIGLGQATKIDTLRITWSSSRKCQEFYDLAVNTYYIASPEKSLSLKN